MSDLGWIVGGLVVGFGVKSLLSASPMRSGGGSGTVKPMSGMVTVLGRPTFIHAPAGATRMLLCFHGFGGNVVAMGPRLVKALGDAPVIAVLPQLGPKSEPGDLSSRMLEYLNAVKKVVGVALPLDGASHSGGYRALAAMIRQANVRGVGLLDSLYGEYPTFASGMFGCLIDIYGSETAALSEQLRKEKAGDSRYQIVRTTTPHDAMPEAYIGQLARAFPGCGKVTVA